MKSVTQWFVLSRFGSCKPTPRWGGHKDRASFNPFSLSNGHLDRVSFLLNQTGHLDPTRITTHLVSLALITSHLENKNENRRKHDCKSQATRATNNTQITLSLSLKLLITNDHLLKLGEIGSFDCVLEWIASSCIECRGLECLGEVNGGGWGCIYSHQPLPSRYSNSADRGRSTPLVRTVRPCTSTAEIATVSSNGYINGYNALNVSLDVR
jgi:hypothetical protein